MGHIINDTAIAFAWPLNCKKYSDWVWRGGKGHGDYEKALKQVYANMMDTIRHRWGPKGARGASCDLFVGTVLRYSKADPYCTPTLTRQLPHWKKSERFYNMGHIPFSKCKAGDVQIYVHGGKGHTRIVVVQNGKKYIAQAHFGGGSKGKRGRFGKIDKESWYTKSTNFYTFRLKDKYNTGSPEGITSQTTTETSTETITTSSSETSFKYIEHYYVKPKDFTDAKDIINTESDIPNIQESARLKNFRTTQDYIKEIFPSYKEYDLINYYDLSVTTLIKQYQRMLQLLENQIVYQNNLKKGQEYLYFYKQLKYCFFEEDYNSYNKNLQYFLIKNNVDIDLGDFKDIYNDISLKLIVLKAFKEASEKYVPVFNTNEYNNFLSTYLLDYDYKISQLFLEKQEYIKPYQSLNFTQNLNEIIKNIQEIKVKINNLQQQQNKIFPKLEQFNKKIKEYQELYDNLYNNKESIKNNFSDLYTFWNKDVILNPRQLNFWLEFIEADDILSKYNVKKIGLRSLAQENNGIRSIYIKNTPNVIYYTENIEKNKTGYNYLKINNLNSLFENSREGLVGKNVIDDLLYKNSYGTEEVSLNTIPIYYLEPNTRIFIYDEKSHVNGKYVINKISNSLNTESMNISANKINERII